jgi:hypothetical protein
MRPVIALVVALAAVVPSAALACGMPMREVKVQVQLADALDAIDAADAPEADAKDEKKDEKQAEKKDEKKAPAAAPQS